MPNYQNGKIYKIICNDTGLCYIGSTTLTLCNRMTTHRYSHKIGKNCSSNVILKNENYSYCLIEKYPCENKEQLKKKEQFYIDSIDCVNKHNSYLTEDKLKELNKKWRDDNKEYIKEKRKEYYETNKEIFKEKNKEWRENNKEKRKIQKKKYYDLNREQILLQKKEEYHSKIISSQL
jgi:hypothetical protein